MFLGNTQASRYYDRQQCALLAARILQGNKSLCKPREWNKNSGKIRQYVSVDEVVYEPPHMGMIHRLSLSVILNSGVFS